MTDEELREVLEGEFEKIGMVSMSARIRGELPSMPGEDAKISAAISAMRRIAAQVRAETVEWQPIETAPKDGTRIIVFRPDADGVRRIGIDKWSHKLGNVWSGSRGGEQPTHWMPLPEPPRALLNKDGG